MREVMIYDDIGSGKITAEKVLSQLSGAKSGTVTPIRINSSGGSVTEGIAIYHAIRGAKGSTVAIVEGVAASMASIVLQACDVRRVARGSYVMIHNPSSQMAGGKADNLRKTADLLDGMRSDMIAIYMRRAKCSQEDLEAMLDAETWLTADQAVEAGLADEVIEEEARINFDAVAKAHPENIPESLRALMQGKSKMTEEEKAKMKALEEECAKLRAELDEKNAKAEDDPPGAGDESEENGKDDEENKPEEEAKARIFAAAQLITGKRKATEIEGALMALGHARASDVASARAGRVEAMVASGKLAPHARKWALEAPESALRAYESTIGEGRVIPVGKIKMGQISAQSSPLSEEEKRLAKYMGVSDDDAIKAKAGK